MQRARKGGRIVELFERSLRIRASTSNLHESVSPIIKGSRGSPGIPNDRGPLISRVRANSWTTTGRCIVASTNWTRKSEPRMRPQIGERCPVMTNSVVEKRTPTFPSSRMNQFFSIILRPFSFLLTILFARFSRIFENHIIFILIFWNCFVSRIRGLRWVKFFKRNEIDENKITYSWLVKRKWIISLEIIN